MIDRIKLFLDEFNSFYNETKYISKREYTNFLSKNKTIFDALEDENLKDTSEYKKLVHIKNNIEEIMKTHNDVFIENALILYKDYFDQITKGISDSVILDEEQRKAILNQEDNTLLMSGAGTGKSLLMLLKAKYLVDKCGISPSEILIVPYNKLMELKVLDESKYLKLDVDVKAFDSFLFDFFNQSELISEKERRNIVSKYIKEEVMNDKDTVKKLLDILSELPYGYEYSDFNNLNEYQRYKLEHIHVSLKDKIEDSNRLLISKKRLYFRTILSEFLRCKEEVKIANFLYMNSIEYKYEQEYEINVSEVLYKPDFTIANGDKKIYIEYFDISEDLKSEKYSSEELELYTKNMDRTINIHSTNNTDLICLYSKYNDGQDYIKHLNDELVSRGITLNKKEELELYKKLLTTNTEIYIDEFINFVMEFIDKTKTNKIKNIRSDQETLMYMEVFKKALDYYNSTLKSINKIDYIDMNNFDFKENVNIDVLRKYKYIFFDEYQEIIDNKIPRKISEVLDTKIIEMADNYQNDQDYLSVSNKLNEIDECSSVINLNNNYKNSQELISVAETFVDKSSLNNSLISTKHIDKPIKIVPYEDKDDSVIWENRSEVLVKIISEIYIKNSKASILLVGRYLNDVNHLTESDDFDIEDDKVISLDFPRANITFMTPNMLKGLEFDYVILLNFIDDVYGFPSKIGADKIFDYISEEQIMENQKEERRLFYLAITRSRNEVYILTSKSKPSKYIFELKENNNVEFKNNLISEYNQKVEEYRCPQCGYYMDKAYDSNLKMWYYRCTNEKELCGFITNNLEKKIPITKCNVCNGYLLGEKEANDLMIIAKCSNPNCLATKFYKVK